MLKNNNGLVIEKITTETFIERANDIHNKLYTYPKSIFVNWDTHIIITCEKHGDFSQLPRNHLSIHGCKKCANELVGDRCRKTKETFVKEGNDVHDSFYIYDKFIYIDAFTKGIITCPSHGGFSQTPDAHLNQEQGCPECGIIKKGNSQRGTHEKFVNDSNAIHKNKYTYVNFIYINNHTKGFITCKEHGDFLQIPLAHTGHEQGCPECDFVKRTGLNYEEYEKTLSERQKYYRKVKSITEKQPIRSLIHHEKRGNYRTEGAYHLDHKYSISEGFRNNIPPEVIGHIANLEFITWRKNSSKYKKCSITIE